jgi:uncharacterized coiled-coil DUF342 family protein
MQIVRPRRLSSALVVAAIAAIGSLASVHCVMAAEPKSPGDSAPVSELQKDREAIDAGKAKVAELRTQIETRGKAIEQEKTDIQALEGEVNLNSEEMKKLKKQASSGGSAQKYNEGAAKHNLKAQEVIDRRKALDESIAQYNELVGQLRTETKVVNDLVIAYNEKLKRKGN